MDLSLIFEKLEDPAYRHVLLNHAPILGLAIAWVVLAAGLLERRWRSILLGLGLVALLSGSGYFVSHAGDAAYPFVFDALDGPGRDWLDYHADLADRWGWLLPANALIAALGIALGAWRPSLRLQAGVAVGVTTLAALATAVAIAEAGGQIRHPEFRLSDPPAVEGNGRIP